MDGEKRKEAIDRLKRSGILQIDHQEKLTELANAIMTRIWEPMKKRIGGSGFETFPMKNVSAQQKTPAIPTKDDDASTPVTVTTISDSGSPSESAMNGCSIVSTTEEIRGTPSNLGQDIQHAPYSAEDCFSFGLGTHTIASFSMHQNALPIPPANEVLETPSMSGLERTGLHTSYSLDGSHELGLDADVMASFSMHQNALPIPPANEVLDTPSMSGLERTGLHTSYSLDGSHELGLDADVMASFSMHQNALPIPPVENSLGIFSTTSLMIEDHDTSPSVYESALPIQTSAHSNPPANVFTRFVGTSNQLTSRSNIYDETGILGSEHAGIPASSPRSEVRIWVS
jgi:hypothetical protein